MFFQSVGRAPSTFYLLRKFDLKSNNLCKRVDPVQQSFQSPYFGNFGSLLPPIGNLTIPEPVATASAPPVTTTTANVTIDTDSARDLDPVTTPGTLLETSGTTTDSSITTTTMTTMTSPDYELDETSTNEEEESLAEAAEVDGTGPTRRKLKRRIRVNPETGQRQVMKRRKVVKAVTGEAAEVEMSQ